MSTSLDIVRTNENLVFFKCQQQAEVGNAIDASNSALLDAEDKIGKEQGLSQRATLAEVEARLTQAMDFNEAELKSQALAQAADDRRTRLASLGERLRSYSVRL